MSTLKEPDAPAAEWFKWSYADYPQLACGDEHFDEVRKAFNDRLHRSRNGSLAQAQEELDLQLDAMGTALRRLDEEGLFGTGERCAGIVINAEIVPPNYTNTVRTLRLNLAAALSEWLRECAEPRP